MTRNGFSSKQTLLVLAAVIATGSALNASALPVVTDFDAFADGTIVTNQIAGMTFTNTMVLQAGGGLNELEFPPRSLSNVVTDSGGPIDIGFASPVFSVGAYFTYAVGLSFSAFDTANVLLGTVVSAFASNLALTGEAGSSPNEFISFADASGRIARVLIAGDATGSSLTLDDLTVDAGPGTQIPEPQSLALSLAALLGAVALRPRHVRRPRAASICNATA